MRRGGPTATSRRLSDDRTLPTIARHPTLEGEIRTINNPQSSVFNTDVQIFSDVGIPCVLVMENYDINRSGYHDTKDTLENIDLDYGADVPGRWTASVAKPATPPPQIPAANPAPPPAKPTAPAAAAAGPSPAAAPKAAQPQPKGCPAGKTMAVVNGQPVCK